MRRLNGISVTRYIRCFIISHMPMSVSLVANISLCFLRSFISYSNCSLVNVLIRSMRFCFSSVRLLSVLRGHSVVSSPPQRPMTSEFEGFLYQILSIILYYNLNS